MKKEYSTPSVKLIRIEGDVNILTVSGDFDPNATGDGDRARPFVDYFDDESVDF